MAIPAASWRGSGCRRFADLRLRADVPRDYQQTQAERAEEAAYPSSGKRNVQTVIVERIQVETGDEQVSLAAMKQALEALERGETKLRYQAIETLRAAIEQAHGDWDEVEALRASLREHMAEIHRLRQWQGLTDDEIVLICGECAASHADDIRYARAIEAKLRDKNA